MHKFNTFQCVLAVAASLALLNGPSWAEISEVAPQQRAALKDLGRALFFETKLSRNGSQSCATCHDPERGFADPRLAAKGAFSLGDDGHSLGNRNAPSAGYAQFVPAFHQRQDGSWAGG